MNLSILLILNSFLFVQPIDEGKSQFDFYQKQYRDTSFTGFCSVYLDSSKKIGVQELGRDEYYLIDTTSQFVFFDVATVKKDKDPITNHWVIYFRLNERGTNDFARFTEYNIGKKVGLIVKGKLMMTISVYEKIAGGQVRLGLRSDEKNADEIVEAILTESTKRTHRQDY